MPVKDVELYQISRRQLGDLADHFPTAIPRDAIVRDFVHVRAAAKDSGAVMRLRLQLRGYQASSLLDSHRHLAISTKSGPAFRVTQFTPELGSTDWIPDDLEVLVLKTKPSYRYKDKLAFSGGIAASPTTGDIVYWAVEW